MLVSNSGAKKRDLNSQFREMLMIDALSKVQKMKPNEFIQTVGMLLKNTMNSLCTFSTPIFIHFSRSLFWGKGYLYRAVSNDCQK